MRQFSIARSSFIVSALFAAFEFAPRIAAAADAKCEPEKLATKYPGLVGKTLKVGTDPETSPYSMRDPKDFNHLIGLDNELAEAAFKCIGAPIEFKVGSWSGQLPALANGQTDLMWDTLYYTPERAQQMDFVIYLRAATGGLVAQWIQSTSSTSTRSAARALSRSRLGRGGPVPQDQRQVRR